MTPQWKKERQEAIESIHDTVKQAFSQYCGALKPRPAHEMTFGEYWGLRGTLESYSRILTALSELQRGESLSTVFHRVSAKKPKELSAVAQRHGTAAGFEEALQLVAALEKEAPAETLGKPLAEWLARLYGRDVKTVAADSAEARAIALRDGAAGIRNLIVPLQYDAFARKGIKAP